MKCEHAEPGDTIETWDGQTYIVLERPKDAVSDHIDGAAWFLPTDERRPRFVPFSCYRVIARGSTQSHGRSSVDESLDEQRDRNLRSIFG